MAQAAMRALCDRREPWGPELRGACTAQMKGRRGSRPHCRSCRGMELKQEGFYPGSGLINLLAMGSVSSYLDTGKGCQNNRQNSKCTD